MSPTVTIDTDSEPGSWARHSVLWIRHSSLTVTPYARLAIDACGQTPPAPTCARCGSVLCGCADHIWKG